MTPHVRFRLPDGETVTLAPGDLIGRNPRAALPVADAAVSEAHALVSLRAGQLKLLGLRGGFVLEPGQPPQREVALAAGQQIWLSRDFQLVVAAVALPSEALVLAGPGLAPTPLWGVVSIRVRDGQAQLTHRFRGSADAWLWSVGDGWQLRVGSGPARTVHPGDGLEVQGVSLRLHTQIRAQHDQGATARGGAVRPPLRIEARYDTVHIHRPDEPVCVLTHTAAKILSELVTFDGPVHWQVLAGEVWDRHADAHTLRGRWDVSFARLRRRLAKARIRADLVRSDGAGHVELLLYPGDQLVDRT